MPIKYNADRLLTSPSTDESFIQNLDVPEHKMKFLRECRRNVRDAIRSEFRQVRSFLKDNNLQHLSRITEMEFSEDDNKKATAEVLKTLEPRFRTQGSMTYGTMNMPCQRPQQIDVDDGVYLPMTVIEGSPVVSKQAFFNIVDRALKKLCETKGWQHDATKNTCSRVIVDHITHIDVPLYAIPDVKFVALSEARAFSDGFALDSAIALNPDEVYLALRNQEHWTISDPKVVSDWFKEQCGYYGVRLKYVSRFLKAWRDYHWENGVISSIALMVCAVQTFRQPGIEFKTTSEALLETVKNLPEQIKNGVRLEVNNDELIFPRGDISQQEKDDLHREAQALYFQVSFALNNALSAEDALGKLINSFGDRVPNRPDYISLFSDDVAKEVRDTQTLKLNHPNDDMEENFISG